MNNDRESETNSARKAENPHDNVVLLRVLDVRTGSCEKILAVWNRGRISTEVKAKRKYQAGPSTSIAVIKTPKNIVTGDRDPGEDEEAKQNYQVEISNRFATLESSDEVEKELDVNSVWENIRDSIKIAAEQSIGYYETKKKKPWFDEDCCMVVERRKQAKLKILQDPVEEKRDNYFNERREASRTLRNKREVT
ncbi:hypothetical protein ANN_09811 [Periplaneta americana]|uniref:Uncharacterized protein n=1 Tax=Periplaneta americana TaxID=6978 RepID=A0ABQ8TNC1_PERAM|nr:hypothetical protein ANN_09811 [Periplaneta americana]